MADILIRQKYFFTLIFMAIVLYFIYFYIYLSVKYKFKYWNYSGKSITSPEFICNKNTKCNLDGHVGYFDGNEEKVVIYKFPNSTENHHILNIENDEKISYSFLLYLDNMKISDENQILQLGSVIDDQNLFKVSHSNGEIIINLGSETQNRDNMISVPSIVYNKWFHVVLSFDTNIVDVYMNGELKQSNLLPNDGNIFARKNPNFLKVFKFSGKIMKIRYFKYNFKPLDASLLYQYYKYINILDSGEIIESDKDSRGQSECETFSPKLKIEKYNQTRIKRNNVEELKKEFIDIHSQMMS
jgi:ABC-type sugar transport system permease subunit